MVWDILTTSVGELSVREQSRWTTLWGRKSVKDVSGIKCKLCLRYGQCKLGRRDRIRTCDPLLPKQMRYRAAPLSDDLMHLLGQSKDVGFGDYGVA